MVSRVPFVSMFVAGMALAAPAAHAQTTPELALFTAEATPIGALPPMALPMPASRDQNYWGLRLQIGQRQERSGPEDLLAVAAGLDYQIRGGSILGLTGGYQRRQHCDPTTFECGGHTLWGARARFNLVTGGPTIATLWRDQSATTTIGTEFGLGFAPRVQSGVNACSLDFGLPLSVSTFERIGLVLFATPGLVWDVRCSGSNETSNRSSFLGFGFGLQQLGFRGLDVHFGAQRIFRGTTGLQYGVSVAWVHLP